MLKVVYHPRAEDELLDAVLHYGADDLGRTTLLLPILDAHVRDIATSPQRYPLVGADVRRCVVKKFPYVIFFREMPDHIRILSISHTSRHPGHWRLRR